VAVGVGAAGGGAIYWAVNQFHQKHQPPEVGKPTPPEPGSPIQIVLSIVFGVALLIAGIYFFSLSRQMYPQ